jgi:hypothetical protein
VVLGTLWWLAQVEDGMALWEVLATHCRDYVAIFYSSDEGLLTDSEACRYWSALDASREGSRAYGLPPLATAPGGARAALATQLAHHLFSVSGMHEMVGNTVELLTDDRGFAVAQALVGPHHPYPPLRVLSIRGSDPCLAGQGTAGR